MKDNSSNSWHTPWHLGVMALLVVALSGCMVGPRVLSSNRPAYNQAIQQSASEELLLNIVRARYIEPMNFLQLGSIIASFNVGAGISGSATVPIHESELTDSPNILNFGANLDYSESPTLTFTPLEVQTFVSQMLTAAPVDMALKVMGSGWQIGTVLSLMASRIGPLSAEYGIAEAEKLFALLELWSKVQARGSMTFEPVPEQSLPVADLSPEQIFPMLYFFAAERGHALFPTPDGKFQLTALGGSTLVIRMAYANSAEADKVDALLGFKAARIEGPNGSVITRLALTNAHEPALALYDESVTEVKIVMRSFEEQLFYASQAIKLPVSEHDKTLTFGWSNSLREVLAINVNESRPDDAFLSVRHRGYWFSINDRDLLSKGTFQLLTVILALQAAAGGAGPNLTVPIGG